MHLVGLYSVSKDLSSIFTQEIATALNRVTFVTTARTGRPLSDAPDRVATILGAYAMIAAPLGIGLAAVAENAVAVLLGAQWLAAAPLLQLIAPASALYAVHKVIASSLQASGLARGAACLSGAGAAAAAVAVGGAALAGGGAPEVASAALAVSAVLLAAGLVVIARIARMRLARLVGAAGRPFLAAGGMLLLVRFAALQTGSAAVDLVLGVAIGAAGYVGLLFLLWHVAGRPAGAETEAAELAGRGAALIGRQGRRVSRRT
jgi:O-antigen/teichoic acid export membrane protein